METAKTENGSTVTTFKAGESVRDTVLGLPQGTSEAQAKAKATEQAAQKASIVDLATRTERNPEAEDKLYKLIRGQIKIKEGLFSQMFAVARMCDSYPVTVGTFAAAEAQAIKDGKVKNLNQLSKQNDNALASYMSLKTVLFGGLRDHEDLSIALQALWTWEAEHEGKEAKFLPEGFLDLWSKRYENPVKGHTQWRKDYTEAQVAPKSLQAKMQAWEYQQKKQQQEQPKSDAPGAEGGMASGGRTQTGNISEKVVEAINKLKKVVHEVYGVVSDETIIKDLDKCGDILSRRAQEIRDAKAKEAEGKGATNEPNSAAAGRPEDVQMEVSESEAPTKPEWISQDFWDECTPDGREYYARLSKEEFEEEQSADLTGAELPDIPESTLTKPDWITDDDWNVASDEERQIMLEDREAYESERAKMHEMEQQDAERKAQ